MTLVDYALDGPVATVTMDDGRVNALSLTMITELRGALDRAVARQAATLDLAAHAATKQRVRGPAVDAIRAGLAADLVDLRGW